MVVDFLFLILAVILWVILIELAYLAGGLILRVASFGGLRAAPRYFPDREFNWFSYRRSGKGWVDVESTVAGEIGFLIFYICLAGLLLFF